MRGAPQSGFAVAMRVIRALISALMRGRPPVERPESLGPILAEATPLPPQDGVGGNDDEGLPPPGPDPGQPDPEKAVRWTKLRPGRRSLVDGELVAQSQVLDGELALTAEQEGEEPEQVEQESDHRAEIVAGSGPTDQPLGQRTGFWRRTAACDHSWRPRNMVKSRRPGTETEFLARVTYFRSLPGAELRRLASRCVTRALRPGQLLFEEGEPCRGLFIVAEGAIEIRQISLRGREQVFHAEGPGATLGEAPLFDRGAYIASAVAIAPTRALFLPRAVVLDLCRRRPAVALAILEGMAQRVRRFAGIVSDLASGPSPNASPATSVTLPALRPSPPEPNWSSG
jgi:CRP-like cAMP-binding protein